MGQRVAILLKKNFGHNKSTITLIHHQWGIGKVIPSILLQEVLKYQYPIDRSLGYIYYNADSKDGKDKKLPIEYFFTFEPLNSPNNNYVTNKVVKTDDKNEDIWDRAVRIRYGNMTDNNNGLILVEVTQKYEDENEQNPKTFGDMFDVKIGFTLGNEETDYCHERMTGWIPMEYEFDRLVSMKEFATRTWYYKDNKRDENHEIYKETVKYIKNVTDIMKFFDIKLVYTKGGEEKRNRKEEHILKVIEGLTKNLPDGERIETPKELMDLNVSFYK